MLSGSVDLENGEVATWVSTCNDTIYRSAAASVCEELGLSTENPTPTYAFPFTANTFKLYDVCEEGMAEEGTGGECTNSSAANGRNSTNCPCSRTDEINTGVGGINCIDGE